MAHRVFWLRSFVVLAAVAALGALATHGPAQGVGEGTQIPGASEVTLSAAWQKYNQMYYPLIRGDKKANEKDMIAVAQAVSQYYVYRLTFHTIKADPKKMATLVQDIERDLNNARDSKNAEFQRIYANELVKCFQKVLALDLFNSGDQPAIYNACALLPALAKIKTQEVEDFVIKLSDGKLAGGKDAHDSIRLSGMKALAEQSPVRVYTILDAAKKDPVLDAQKKRDLDRVNALLKFITRPMPQNVTPEAEHFMRRQALRALARCEVPAVEIDNVNKVHGPAAYGLLRALVKNKEGLKPPADLTERLEAAIGICHLKIDSKADQRELYQADMGIYLVGLFIGDFVDAYRPDHARFGTGVGIKKGKKGEPPLEVVPVQPWKSHAKRLESALKQLVTNSKNTPVEDKVKKFEPYAQKYLADIQSYRQVEIYDRAGIQNTLRPKEPAIFKKTKEKEPNFLE